jgi:hypothetical protein
MPTRRELIVATASFTLMPWTIAEQAMEMKNKLVPVLPIEQKINLKNIDYKAYLALAIKKADEFIEVHKLELIQYGLIILALSILLAAGIPPTKELILYLVI